MKRHESIVALSRDHHFGLLFCWKIRQGIKKQLPAERIRPYVTYFWNHHLERHFQEEENLLFAAVQNQLVDRALSEHRQIKAAVAHIRAEDDLHVDPLNALADLVDQHIRFEERVLFPQLERELSAERLAALGQQLNQLHANPEPDNYLDAFWV